MRPKSSAIFTVQKTQKNSRARTGILRTPHGIIHTPVFMPVGTKATVKAMKPEELVKLGTEIVLANTYHLFLRPGEKLIKKMGKLHKWMNWRGPILTDSGGFQVFSLGREGGTKVTEKGVEFQSHIDGTKHFMTPEKAIKIQHDLGSDIIMAFDECAPGTSDKTYARKAMERTHAWVKICKKTHEKLCKKIPTKSRPLLFPIVQGVVYDDLRIESAKYMAALDLPGIAIGGLSVGESKSQMYHTLDILEPHLPKEKPRYLMGVGTPEDLLEAVDRGIDMFDCVLPTRLARHGTFWTTRGRFHIKHTAYKFSQKPLDPKCICYTCKNYSSSYLRHIFLEHEILAMSLLTEHNLHFLLNLMSKIRDSIRKNSFLSFKKTFLSKFKISTTS